MARGGRRPDGVVGGVRWHSGTLYGALRRQRRIAYRALYCTTTEASSNRTTIRPILAPDRVPRLPVRGTPDAAAAEQVVGGRLVGMRRAPPDRYARPERRVAVSRQTGTRPAVSPTTEFPPRSTALSVVHNCTHGLGRAKWAKVMILYRRRRRTGAPRIVYPPPSGLSRVSRIGSARRTQVDPTSNIDMYA